MDFYLGFYLINISFAYFADKSSSKPLQWICLFAIVLLHTFILGCRDFGVGIDTNVYIHTYFSQAEELYNIKDFITSETDKGFLLLAWLCSKFSSDPQSLLIGTEAFVISFMVLGMYQYKKIYNVKLWMMLTLFCFLYSMHNLNLMRQSCAVAMLFFAFSLFLQKKILPFILLQVCAFFFHSTAVLFLLAIVCYYIARIRNTKLRACGAMALIIGAISSLYLYYYIVLSLGESGIISDLYADRYGAVSNYTAGGFSRLGIRFTAMNALMVFLIFKSKVKNYISNNEYYFILMLYCISCIVIQYLPMIVSYIGRLGHYFMVVMIVYYARVLLEKKLPFFLRVFFFLFSIVLDWYLIFIHSNGGDVIPFHSKILGIG